MLLLTLFAVLAGAATALSPCALPVLPVVFSAGSTGGRRRPAGVAIGLAVSFTFAVVVLVYLLAALGLPDELLRTFAIGILFLFGLSLVVPQLGDRVEAVFSRMTARTAGAVSSRATTRSGEKDGFWSGFVIGSGLGLVYAPCAGPILAGVITVTASQEFTLERLVVAAAYGLGSAVTFFVLMLGGRRLIAPLARRTPAVQTAMGTTMILLAFAMYLDLDVRFQTTIADKLPQAIVNPTGSLERSSAVKSSLSEAKGGQPEGRSPLPLAPAADGSERLPSLGPAAEFEGNQRWFNTANNQPLKLADLRGKVVLVDFWTYTCINCIRTLPHLKALWSKYRDDGLVIVGVHSPEFPFERSAANVQDAIDQNELGYPVAQDNDFKTWDAYENQYWPAKYLIDAEGRVRYMHVGEGDYEETDAAVRDLLVEAGARDVSDEQVDVKPERIENFHALTAETYLGSARAAGFMNGTIVDGVHDYRRIKELPVNTLAYGGRWKIDSQSATASGARSTIDLHFNARRVYLVLGNRGGPKKVRVQLDGEPISSGDAGRHVKSGVLTVDGQKLYSIVDLGRVRSGRLSLQVGEGVSGYAFTFG